MRELEEKSVCTVCVWAGPNNVFESAAAYMAGLGGKTEIPFKHNNEQIGVVRNFRIEGGMVKGDVFRFKGGTA